MKRSRKRASTRRELRNSRRPSWDRSRSCRSLPCGPESSDGSARSPWTAADRRESSSGSCSRASNPIERQPGPPSQERIRPRPPSWKCSRAPLADPRCLGVDRGGKRLAQSIRDRGRTRAPLGVIRAMGTRDRTPRRRPRTSPSDGMDEREDAGSVSEAEIAVHWREEDRVDPPGSLRVDQRVGPDHSGAIREGGVPGVLRGIREPPVLVQALDADPRREPSAVLPLVRGRRAQRILQLRRPAPRRAGRPGGVPICPGTRKANPRRCSRSVRCTPG